MPFYGKRKSIKRRYKPRYKKPAYKKRYARKAPIRKIIRREISRVAETKSNNYTATLSVGTLQSTSASLVGNMLVVTPSQSPFGYTIAKGTDDNQRIGNQISIKRLTHRFILNLQPYNATSNTQPRPVYVRMYYFKSKWAPNQDVALGNLCGANANFFQNQATDYGFVGSLFDLTRKMQSENYTYLCHRTYKMGTAIQQNGATTTTANYVASNNDFKLSVIATVNLARFCKRKWTFNDANQVINPWIFCVLQVLDASNTVLATSQSVVQMNSTMEVEYTDI